MSVALAFLFGAGGVSAEERGQIVHDAEHYILEAQNGERWATAFCGRGHLGDIEESYLHNQGFDEALFSPMNQITSLYSLSLPFTNSALPANHGKPAPRKSEPRNLR